MREAARWCRYISVSKLVTHPYHHLTLLYTDQSYCPAVVTTVKMENKIQRYCKYLGPSRRQMHHPLALSPGHLQRAAIEINMIFSSCFQSLHKGNLTFSCNADMCQREMEADSHPHKLGTPITDTQAGHPKCICAPPKHWHGKFNFCCIQPSSLHLIWSKIKCFLFNRWNIYLHAFQFKHNLQKGSLETSKFKEKPKIIITSTTTEILPLFSFWANYKNFIRSSWFFLSFFLSLEKRLSSVRSHGVFEKGNGSTCLPWSSFNAILK